MTSFFEIMFTGDDRFGVAQTVSSGWIFLLPDLGIVENWESFVLEVLDGDFSDYQASNLACRMCSNLLRDILTSSASADDELQWLPVLVQKGLDKRPYSILHFPNPPDVIDRERAVMVDDFVIKPALSLAASQSHRVFSYPKGRELTLIVDQRVKQEIEAAGCTGLQFHRVHAR